jgi:formate-dependent nitrite reductase cytochrome c552 subunit
LLVNIFTRQIVRSSGRTGGYDVNRDATRQEMRSFVCGQCHVKYYFKGPEKRLTYPWSKGLRADDIRGYYEKAGVSADSSSISVPPSPPRCRRSNTKTPPSPRSCPA